MKQAYMRLGFAVSGVLHLVLLATFLMPGPVVPEAATEEPLSIDLAMFEAVALAEPEPVAEPAPLAVPEPRPVEPLPSVVPESVSVEQAKPQAVIEKVSAKPPVEPAHEPSPRPARVAKPKPAKPVVKPQQLIAAAPQTVDRHNESALKISREQVRRQYLASLIARIQQRKFYPRAARRRGEEGKVVVSFVVSRSGELMDLRVSESSGRRRLDEAALKTLRRASPFLPIPPEIGRDSWPIAVPIAFSLSS